MNDDTEFQTRWIRIRRPVLLVSAASLFAIGLVLNLEPPTPVRDDAWDDEPLPPAQRYASYMIVPEEVGEAEPPAASHDVYPAMQARNAGILGQMAQESGHSLASPYGGAFAVGSDAEDVWGGITGSEVGEAFGVGGLGLVGTGRGGGGDAGPTSGVGSGHGHGTYAMRGPRADEHYAPVMENGWIDAARDARSTFAIDVDTASYSNVRRFIQQSQQLPPQAAVRIEEMINYFDYDYPEPTGDDPFSVIAEVGPCPWNPEHQLVHIGVQGKHVAEADTPPRNLVFLVDVSGSMESSERLPLVKRSLAELTETLGPDDRIALVVYAGAAGVVLPPTSGADQHTILEAIFGLGAGGSTNGAEGIAAAYRLARESFIPGGINRVVLATDGDFNVGLVGDALVRRIEEERESGVFLSVLGFGVGNKQDVTMEQLADKGNGNYAYIDTIAEARKVLVEEGGGTLHAIAKDVKIQVELDPRAVERFRLVGYENRMLAHRDFTDDKKDAGEIGAGHTVTAIYEIDRRGDVADGSLMQLHLRYKAPGADESRPLDFDVADRVVDLDETSDDFRFSAAVAQFAMLLRGSEQVGDATYATTLALATTGLGDDPKCRRHELAALVHAAGTIAGEAMPNADFSDCEVTFVPPKRGTVPALVPVEEPSDAPLEEPSDGDDWRFFLEVLRLLPPLLGLPLFIMALRNPRRRRD